MPEKRKRFDIFSEDEIKQKRLIRIRMELGTMAGIRIELGTMAGMYTWILDWIQYQLSLKFCNLVLEIGISMELGTIYYEYIELWIYKGKYVLVLGIPDEIQYNSCSNPLDEILLQELGQNKGQWWRFLDGCD